MEVTSGSNLALLVLETSKGKVKVPCEYRYTCNALMACFGEVNVIGKEIVYRCDVAGVLEVIDKPDKEKE